MGALQHLRNTFRFIGEHPLTRHQPASALARYLWWQGRQRCLSNPAAVRFVNQSRLLIPPHAHGLTGYLYVGLPDFEDSAFVLHLLRRDDSFADVGANAGAWTVMIGAGIGARVDSFEPIPEARAQLEANVEINGIRNSVRLHATGVGSAPGCRWFTSGEGTANRVVLDGESMNRGHLEIPMTTLDIACAADAPTAIKIDVEGWELEVIRGAAKLLANPKLLGLVVETFRQSNLGQPKLQEMEAILAEHGFLPAAYDPFTRRMCPAETATRRSDNTIYVRMNEEVVRRLVEAPAFEILGQRV